MVKPYIFAITFILLIVTVVLMSIYAPRKSEYFKKGLQVQCDNVFKWVKLAKCENDQWTKIGEISVMCEGTRIYSKKVCDDYCKNLTHCNYDNTTTAYKVGSKFMSEQAWKSIKYNNKVFIIMCSLFVVNAIITISIGVIYCIEYNRKTHINNELTEQLV